MTRYDEIAANLADVRHRIALACQSAGRSPEEITLVAVTKTRPAEDVEVLVALGVHDVGENRDQEAAAKAEQLRDLNVRWHFIGQLQTNKCRSVAAYASVVHSVDRLRLVTALDHAALAAGRRLTALVQVSLDPSDAEGRGGARPEDVPALGDAIAGSQSLEIGGVMAVAPLHGDAGEAFARLADVAAAVRRAHPKARIVSAGMSGDLEAAIAHGATHVRVGTALLGVRPPLVR